MLLWPRSDRTNPAVYMVYIIHHVTCCLTSESSPDAYFVLGTIEIVPLWAFGTKIICEATPDKISFPNVHSGAVPMVSKK